MKTTELEKIFANHISGKGLVSRIYKKLLQLNNIKKIQLKTGKGSNRHVSKEDKQMTSNHDKMLNILS